MLDALAMEERALRRRLLFRLLKDFDFEAPMPWNIMVADPVTPRVAMQAQASDHFVFSFESQGF